MVAEKLYGLVTVQVPGKEAATRRLTRQREGFIGRGMGWYMPMRAAWCPRELLGLTPIDGGWLAHNFRDNLVVEGPSIRRAELDADAKLLLGVGAWTFTWPLKEELEVSIWVKSSLTADQMRLPLAGPAPREREKVGTARALPILSPEERQRLAIVFRHLLDDSDKPANLCRERAPLLGTDEANLRAWLNRIRVRTNAAGARGRPPLKNVDEMGEYLIRMDEVRMRDLPR